MPTILDCKVKPKDFAARHRAGNIWEVWSHLTPSEILFIEGVDNTGLPTKNGCAVWIDERYDSQAVLEKIEKLNMQKVNKQPQHELLSLRWFEFVKATKALLKQLIPSLK